MDRIKIILETPEATMKFVNICSCFSSDVNVYDGSITLDAKSLVSMFCIADKKEIEVEMISSDEGEKIRFIEKIKSYIRGN